MRTLGTLEVTVSIDPAKLSGLKDATKAVDEAKNNLENAFDDLEEVIKTKIKNVLGDHVEVEVDF